MISSSISPLRPKILGQGGAATTLYREVSARVIAAGGTVFITLQEFKTILGCAK